jgi:broad specificity phosphatase PhoE
MNPFSQFSQFLKRFDQYRPKKVYFVRHGETLLNAQHIRQGSGGGLSNKGKQQATLTGQRLQLFPIDVIIVSPFERTQETAAIINTFLKKPIEYSDLLKERRNPSEIIGKWADDVEVRRITDLIDKSFHDSNLRYSDEENFEDLKLRAEQLLDFLAARPERNILCVTHGIFLTMVIAVMQYRESLTAEEYIKLSFYNQANNAGITVCEFKPLEKKSPTHGWNLLAWNDYTRKL